MQLHALTLLAAAALASAACTRTYEVRPGDTCWLLNDVYQLQNFYRCNLNIDCSRLQIGQVVRFGPLDG